MPELHAVEADLSIAFDRSFHIGTGRAEGLVNRTVKRTAQGEPYVPASALKGALRENAERLIRRFDERAEQLEVAPEKFLGYRRRGTSVLDVPCEAPKPENMCKSETPCIVCRLFGNPLTGRRLIVDDARPSDGDEPGSDGDTDNGDEPHEMEYHRSSKATEAYTHLRIDRRRKGAKAQALFTSENARPAHLQSRLSGEIPLTPLDDAPPAEVVLLAATLAATDQVGGGASAGRGQCLIQVQGPIRVDDHSYQPTEAVEALKALVNSLVFA